MVAEQIKLVFEAFPVGAVKTGMLFSSAIIREVAKQLGKRRGLKLVVDPVMVATSGAALLKPDAERAMAKFLFPRAALVTPNLDEAARLVGSKLRNPEQAKEAGLVDRIGFLEDAVARAVELAGLDEKTARVVKYSRPKGLLDEVLASQGAGARLSLDSLAELATPRAWYLCSWWPVLVRSE